MNNKKVTYSIMARKLWLPLCLVCLIFTYGCGNLYTGEENIFNPDRDESIQEESVPVMVAFSDPYYNILSRGMGKIDPEEDYFLDKMNPVDEEGKPDESRKPRFFIYAFRQNNSEGYGVTRAQDKEVCLIDGSCGTQADWVREKEPLLAGHGKWAHYNGNGSFISWHFTDTDKLYYSDQSQMTPFDFFAYFHDGAASGPVNRTGDRISFPVKIDGSQDLMCGVAELTEEQKETIKAMEDEEEKQKIKEFSYSTYTGRRNIWPIFQMKHQLAYVKFNLIAGNSYGDPVKVHNMSLKTHTEGTFVVASTDKKIGATFNESEEQKYLLLKDLENGNTITAEIWEERFEKNEYRLEYFSEEEKIANGGKIRPDPYTAGELLVPPGNNAVLQMILSNEDTGFDNPETMEVPLKDKVGENGSGFMAGREYNLNITVYGPKQISIEVKASPWRDGGDIDIDIEDDQQK